MDLTASKTNDVEMDVIPTSFQGSSALHEWLARSSHEFFGEDDWTTAQMFSWVGSKVFNLSESESTYSKIVELICDQLGEYLSTPIRESEINAIEALLICAVAESCEERAYFVQIILDMDKDAQVDLMRAIKNNMSHLNPDSLQDAEMAEGQYLVDVEQPTVDSTSNSSNINDSGRAERCPQCFQASKQIEDLQHQLDMAEKRYHDFECQTKVELSAESNKLIDAELALLESDKAVQSLHEELQVVRQRAADLNTLEAQNRALQQKLSALADEVDVLRPLAAASDANEVQLQKLRARLDELQSVRQQLHNESEAHAQTYSKLLEAEKEVESLRRCRAQVEEYRMRLTEVILERDDLVSKLKATETSMQNLLSQNTALTSSQEEHAMQSRFLADELHAVHMSAADRSGAFGGIGEGVSEMNPVLMQELGRLRSENEMLRDQLDATALDALERIRGDLADARCRGDTLQKRLNATSESLAASQAHGVRLEAELRNLRAQFTAYQEQQREGWLMQQSDLAARNSIHNHELQTFWRRSAAHVNLMTVGHLAVRSELSTELANRTADLKATTEELTISQSNCTRTTEQLTSCLVDLQAERDARAADCANLEAQLKEQAAASVAALDLARAEQQQRIETMEEAHAVAIAQEVERQRSLQADVDEERLKRRRVEREKKLVEAEAHKYKAQAHSAGSGDGSCSSGGDIDATVKELRAMQVELDTVRAELSSLRASTGRPIESSISSVKSATHTSSSSEQDPAIDAVGLSARPQRLRPQDRDAKAKQLNGAYVSFLEATEINDKRVEQLSREKRELLAKSLEASKERAELAQKLLMQEKEIAALKSKVTKVTLDKERLERKFSKTAEVTGGPACEDIENISGNVGLQASRTARNNTAAVGTKRSRIDDFM